ncbi:CUB and sushi domain-containing protein 3 isoform X1, partial [Sigmodon hispidus]
MFLEQALHSAVLCLSQGLEEGLAMTLQLVHWSFLNVTQDTSSMAPEPLDVKQCPILWPNGMIPYLLAL